MSNLLKDASILLTPTAYDNGRMNASKPSKDLYGPELVTNGDFATDSDWAGGTEWSISGGSANCDGTQTATTNFFQPNVISDQSKTYKVEFTLSNYVSGLVKTKISNDAQGANRTANGTYVDYLSGMTNNQLNFTASSDFIGSIDNVSVKEDLSGDFQFERNSAATRVNAQGLVENVQIISPELVSNGNFSQIGTEEVLNGNFSQEGSELVTNGDFSNGLNNWSVNGGSYATIVDGALNSNNTENGSWFAENISQNISFVNGKTYKVTFKAKNISGSLNLRITHQSHIVFNDNLTSNFVDYTVYYTSQAPNDSIRIFCNDDVGEFEIDNLSIKEVGQNWGLDSGWSIQNGQAICNGVGVNSIQQSGVTTTGKTYKLTFDIISKSNDDFLIISTNFGDTYINGSSTSLGTNTFYITPTSGTGIRFRVANGTTLTIDNVSVKEVGQDWEFTDQSEIEVGQAKLISTDGSSQNISQLNTLVVGKKYRLQYEVLENNSGQISMTLSFGSGYGGLDSSVGIHTIDAEATNTTLQFKRNSGVTDITITNISVKEITDDTNIPRINYEGFSYQDSLGSELVTNGGFATDTYWNKQSGWIITNGYAESTALGTRSIFQNTGTIVVGNTYQVTYTILETNGGNFRFNLGGVNGTNRNSIGTYTENIVAASTSGIIYLDALNVMIGKIDNVSVKEYLGQEVVPDSGCGSWLLEPQSTNLITQSELFSDASWVKSNSTIVSSSIISPSGSLNSDKLVESSNSSSHGINFNYSSTSSMSFSVFAKAAERTFIQLQAGGVGSTDGVFNLSNGTIFIEEANATANIEDYGNGWYRCSVSYSSSGVNNPTIKLYNGGDNYQGDGTSGLYIWGAQLEALSYATSYIPTNGATNTRLKDIADNSGNSTLINSAEGVLYAEIAALEATSSGSTYITITDGTYNNRASILFSNGATNQIRTFLRVGGATQIDVSDNVSDVTDFNKIAFSYKENDFKVYINGALVSSDTSGSVWPTNTINKLTFSEIGTTAGIFKGKNKALAVYKEALTDANLRCLTYPNPVATTFDLDFDTIAEQFTFTRGSEATFVNEQGLIQSTNTLTSNLVINEESLPLAGWSRDGDVYTAVNATSNVALNYTSGFNFSIGDLVEVSYEVFDYASGNVRVQLSGGGSAAYTAIVSSNGVFTETLLLTGNNTAGAILSNSTNPTLKIRNVSIKKIITATNTPRIDYSTGAEAFLLEPQSTNLIPYSDDFSNSAWTKTRCIIDAGGHTSPSGENNAFKMTATDDDARLQDGSGSTGVIYTQSIYVKSATGSDVNGQIDFTGAQIVTFTATEQWQRVVTTSDNTRVGRVRVRITNSGDELLIWGAQLEALSYATSYIPTSGASATRNQELCADATPVINSEEGTLYAEISALANSGTFRIISLTDGSTPNRVSLIYSTTNNSFRIMVVSSGSTIFDEQRAVTSTLDFHKVAIKYKANDFAVWIDGGEVATGTSGATPIGLDRITFDVGNGTLNFFGNTKGLKVYPKALADVQLEDLTTI